MENRQGKVLITGATGFIGSRLTRVLLEQGLTVRCVARNNSVEIPAEAEFVPANMLEPATLKRVMEGIDCAYYLVHSMSGGRAGFERRDREAAENFVTAANQSAVRRVIYLGGLGETGDALSEHLKSRLEVADILQRGKFATTFLRAAIIIGAG